MPGVRTWLAVPGCSACPPGKMSSGLSRVPMMESADHRDLHDAPLLGWLHRPWIRGVLFKREMCATAVVIAEVTSNNPSEVIFAQNDDVIEAASALPTADWPADILRMSSRS